jgi:hypothetical protein
VVSLVNSKKLNMWSLDANQGTIQELFACKKKSTLSDNWKYHSEYLQAQQRNNYLHGLNFESSYHGRNNRKLRKEKILPWKYNSYPSCGPTCQRIRFQSCYTSMKMRETSCKHVSKNILSHGNLQTLLNALNF